MKSKAKSRKRAVQVTKINSTELQAIFATQLLTETLKGMRADISALQKQISALQMTLASQMVHKAMSKVS